MSAEQRIEQYLRDVRSDEWRGDDAAFVADVRSVLAELQAAQEREKALREAAEEVRTGLGLTAYEGTPVSVWSAKHYEGILADALAAQRTEEAVE